MTYRPGHIEGKIRKAFYLDEAIAKALAHRSVDSGLSQSEIVEQALHRELNISGNASAPTKLTLQLVNRAEVQVDWSVGYLDGMPAVGDALSNWYVVPKDVAVLNKYEGLVWSLQNGKWVSTPRREWQGEISAQGWWTEGGSDFVEEDDTSR